MDNIWESLPVGAKFLSQGRTISEGDFSLLINANWTFMPLHTNSEYMKSTQFGGRILPGVCVLSTSQGLTNTSDFRRPFSERGLRPTALLGFENVRFSGPVYPGDTITVEVEILDVRPTSKPNRGVIRLKLVSRKQTGEKVMEGIRVDLYETVQ